MDFHDVRIAQSDFTRVWNEPLASCTQATVCAGIIRPSTTRRVTLSDAELCSDLLCLERTLRVAAAA